MHLIRTADTAAQNKNSELTDRTAQGLRTRTANTAAQNKDR